MKYAAEKVAGEAAATLEQEFIALLDQTIRALDDLHLQLDAIEDVLAQPEAIAA